MYITKNLGEFKIPRTIQISILYCICERTVKKLTKLKSDKTLLSKSISFPIDKHVLLILKRSYKTFVIPDSNFIIYNYQWSMLQCFAFHRKYGYSCFLLNGKFNQHFPLNPLLSDPLRATAK